MLGQDTIKLSFTDTLNAVAESFPATVFDLSNIAGGGVQGEESMEMIQKAHSGLLHTAQLLILMGGIRYLAK